MRTAAAVLLARSVSNEQLMNAMLTFFAILIIDVGVATIAILTAIGHLERKVDKFSKTQDGTYSQINRSDYPTWGPNVR